ncbi:hypothetical protein IFM89_027199 [Coptis chinensis]|uniref:Uncharacterized protein n=1 Tax=Coptis chinensis TaxID=261450 RepID=A0A835I5U8_9MAGN|nr:hypothetical protein IFM89_027199 [Coptis chinensis]
MMSIKAISFTSYDLCNLHGSVALHPHRLSRSLKANKQGHFFANQGLLLFRINHKRHIKHFMKMEVKAANEIYQVALSGSNFPGWSNWIWGGLLALIISMIKNNWGPFQLLKKEVVSAIKTAEMVTEMVEEVAEKVEEVAEEIADKHPGDVKLKDAIERIENLAKEAVKDAKTVEGGLHKVEEAEKKLEDALAPGKDQENVINQKKI